MSILITAAIMLTAGAPLDWPIEGRITSQYGSRWGQLHGGLDIGAAEGQWVRAAADGMVIYAAEYGNYGNLVTVRHANKVVTYYAHLKNMCVFRWQKVKKGQRIGRIGMTGRTTGPHLHFEVRVHKKSQDPLLWLSPTVGEDTESTAVGGP